MRVRVRTLVCDTEYGVGAKFHLVERSLRSAPRGRHASSFEPLRALRARYPNPNLAMRLG